MNSPKELSQSCVIRLWPDASVRMRSSLPGLLTVGVLLLTRWRKYIARCWGGESIRVWSRICRWRARVLFQRVGWRPSSDYRLHICQELAATSQVKHEFNNMKTPKVLIVGLDAATWDLA